MAPQLQQDFLRPFKVGLIGFGAIAREVLLNSQHAGIEWTVLTRSAAHADRAQQNIRFVHEISALIETRPCVVIEAAGQTALAEYGPALLGAGIPVIVASVGAFADEDLLMALTRACQKTDASLIIPSGAIGGLDYLSAISSLEDIRIRYTSRKPSAAWKAELEKRNLVCATKPVTLFEGSPAEAARLYPKNLNAALTLALTARPATLTVRVVVDPQAKGNTHEIEAESAAGTAFMRFENVPSPVNPKTSTITALSLASALRKFLHPKGMN